jgi:hypothetical protein
VVITTEARFYLQVLQARLASIKAQMQTVGRFDDAFSPLNAERDEVEAEIEIILDETGAV